MLKPFQRLSGKLFVGYDVIMTSQSVGGENLLEETADEIGRPINS